MTDSGNASVVTAADGFVVFAWTNVNGAGSEASGDLDEASEGASDGTAASVPNGASCVSTAPVVQTYEPATSSHICEAGQSFSSG